jgi:hypothetical protein
VRLNNLINLLTDLQDRGFGDRRVIDDRGNDVAEVAEPVDDPGDPSAGDIVLHCYIDYDLRSE